MPMGSLSYKAPQGCAPHSLRNTALITIPKILYLYLPETTTSRSTTTNEDESSSSATDSPWPPDLNCTIAIPICTVDPTSFHDPSFTTTEDGTTTEEFDFTINGTDPFENATFQPSCPKYEFDEDAPCPSRCRVEEKKSRMPTTEDLLIIPDEMKDLLRKKCWETAFGQVSESWRNLSLIPIVIDMPYLRKLMTDPNIKMVTPTLMSNETAIYLIPAEVAVHWRRIISTLTADSQSWVTSLDCHLTSRHTLHICNTDYHNTPQIPPRLL
ncbi:transmembrane channel-like protein 3 [Trichonephila clavipes]|nr:transmembrane channel-like protein 3 [Trichonephila clavipes]